MRKDIVFQNIVTNETDMAVIYIAMTHVSRGQTMFNKI